MREIIIKVTRKQDAKDLPLPFYSTEGSSGMDLYADVENDTVIEPHEIKLISCGIYLSIPRGFEGEVRPRSGLALKHGITLVNTPGTIDSDYRGLLSIIMTNLGKEAFTIKRGDRVAQLVIKEAICAKLVETEELDETARAAGGFGHTGIK